ncbi:glycerophosphodiester phosphodiesterase [Waterburya agarophytonicola K14]|uniref:Glycerophosphodiester phosphodiesterase n=1 Tax=Waterburya agarophytonicola KI4 TaxID=2874699 RepID=A0A964BR78_9CYAN|nr:glycerophosphodiester phosphodiesterase family protein [Waterburya agarophytonicola]MCC0177068.1 glycerophosphodiester phosphodiesterase [Waterburya agarophytonicola KI4]
MLCIGHRGAMGHEPENTLLSIAKALELGVDAVEIDVHNVEDRLVVIHDRDLSRTTNGTGYLENYSFAYLRTLDAGKGQQIPTLVEVLNAVDRQAIVNIELKGNNTAKLAADTILKYIDLGWSYSDFLVSSFNHYELNQIKTIEPKIETGILFYGLPWKYTKIAHELGANIVISNLDYVDANLVATVHQENLQAWAYTVNKPQDISKMRELGVDGIFTNYPDIFNDHQPI